MTTFQKINIVMSVAILLVFSSATMAWSWTTSWEEVKQDVKASGEKLEAGVKQAGDKLEQGFKQGMEGVEKGIDKLEQGFKQGMEGVEKGIDKLEQGFKQGMEGVEKGIDDLEAKIPEWIQNVEDGLQKGGEKIGQVLRQIDEKIDRSGKGCGSGLTTKIVKDNWLMFDFTSACETHDQCYERCNSSRKACDTDFFTQLQQACPSQEEERVKYQICSEITKLYWYTVSKTGNSAWTKAQTTCR
ncbi:MAG: hypothetical protein DRR16_33640 [Candidatus Parabeggiatoa sp. nov. 3]|nr:MAG: hypothetical protein DRR00_17745 [Gammaproteobacteria bacterium]RKZ50717.1 MAG: hypothetical protein DRQ99_33650 [Gammaproteobacteria bacterium]RKZ72840.1 MAG: hypothetical protein DRR16_33640 [Gammaproteobacteria bacterium]